MARNKAPKTLKEVDALRHDASRKNIPTAEYQSLVPESDLDPIPVAYARRNRDLDPQLVWRGKDDQDWSDLVVPAPPLYIQEKVHPKVLIDDLRRASSTHRTPTDEQLGLDLFSDFDGIPEGVDHTEFYQHEQNWSNRMILGDSLEVMASLAEREGLRGKVQCIYIDPPYGIKFGSNFQWSTTSRAVKDGNATHITREPEQVRAYRDTWRDGVHSYLTYLRDRFTVARDLLGASGALFVQIGDDNVHRVRALLDEVFGSENAVATIVFKKTSALGGRHLDVVNDTLLFYAKDRQSLKYRNLFLSSGDDTYAFPNVEGASGEWRRLSSADRRLYEPAMGRLFRTSNLTSQSGGATTSFPVHFQGRTVTPSKGSYWKTNEAGMAVLAKAGRLRVIGNTLTYTRYQEDFPVRRLTAWWDDTIQSTFATENIFVVQTYTKVVQRCLLMTTDPGDLVLDPTCGSGTTATVAEQWGRRWVTIDTSRVALAIARARIMGARYPAYLLADSREGQRKEAALSQSAPIDRPTYGLVRHGFVYNRVPHITLKSIVDNSEVEVIWGDWDARIGDTLANLNSSLGTSWREWEVPRSADSSWASAAQESHRQFWEAWAGRKREIDSAINSRAESERLVDQPLIDARRVRVAGPFTVESLSPHRFIGVDENGELRDDRASEGASTYSEPPDFASIVLDSLRVAGVHQAHKEDRISLTALTTWPGDLICGDGRYLEGDLERRAAIFIGPEFGTVQRGDLIAAAREAADAGFDVLLALAFNFDAHTTEFTKLGRVPVLKARINADLHMAGELKNTGSGNLFVIFGEPDIDLIETDDGQVRVKLNGVDVFKPQSGEVVSSTTDEIACWFVDTDYNEESFFVRQAYFLGANDPYNALRTTLKAEIDQDAWATLHSDISRPFTRPEGGRIAVKVINHLGDEVMKVFRA